MMRGPRAFLLPLCGPSWASACAHQARRGFAKETKPCKMGSRRSSGGGTGTYLGPWRSREPWLAWCPVIPLRREWWRLQPQTWARRQHPSVHPTQLSTPVTNTGYTGMGSFSLPSSPLYAGVGSDLPLSPALTSPGPAQNGLGRCVQKKWGSGEGEEFVLPSTMTLWALSVGPETRSLLCGSEEAEGKEISRGIRCRVTGNRRARQSTEGDGRVERDWGRVCFSRWQGQFLRGEAALLRPAGGGGQHGRGGRRSRWVRGSRLECTSGSPEAAWTEHGPPPVSVLGGLGWTPNMLVKQAPNDALGTTA